MQCITERGKSKPTLRLSHIARENSDTYCMSMHVCTRRQGRGCSWSAGVYRGNDVCNSACEETCVVAMGEHLHRQDRSQDTQHQNALLLTNRHRSLARGGEIDILMQHRKRRRRGGCVFLLCHTAVPRSFSRRSPAELPEPASRSSGTNTVSPDAVSASTAFPPSSSPSSEE